MKPPFLLSLLLCSLLLLGCQNTTSRHPVGQQGSPLKPEQWTGHWMGSSGMAFNTAIKDAKRGLITVSDFPDLDDEKTHRTMAPFVVMIRMLGDDTIGSTKEKNFDGKPGHYLFGRVAELDNALVVFPPNNDVFLALEREKILPCSRKSDQHGKPTDDVIVDDLNDAVIAKHLKGTKYENTALFKKDPILVFIRSDAAKGK